MSALCLDYHETKNQVNTIRKAYQLINERAKVETLTLLSESTMLRVDLRIAVDAGRLEESGAVEVFLPALVFLTGLFLTGAKTPGAALFSTSNGS